VYGCVRVQPEQRYLGKLVELVVPDLAQQARPLRHVHYSAEGLQAFLDEWVLIPIAHRILGLMDITRHLQGPCGVARGEQRPMDRLGAVELADPGELRFHQLRLEPDGLEIERHGLPDIDDLREPWQGVEIEGELEALRISRLRQERLSFRRIIAV